MNTHEVRYFFEHRLLPNWFYENKEQFIGMVLSDKGILFRVISDIFKKEGVENPYTEDDFKTEAAKIADGIMMLKIKFPEPEDEPLCYSAFMFFDEKFESMDYFCIEKGNVLGEMKPFVCSWGPDGSQNNHGNCTTEENDDFQRCADVFINKYYDVE